MGERLRYFWLSALTMLTALFALPAFANQIGEVGTQASVDHNWVTVTLSGTYTDPIVVAKSRNLNGTDISQTRVQNVTSTSFQVKVKDFDYEGQTRVAQTVSYIVVERGAWVLPNGQKIEAGDVSMGCCDIDASTSFSTQFDAAPAVIATPNTNRTQSVYYRVKDLTATSFNARFTDADAAGDPDMLNWIAMETGGDTTYGIGALLTTTQGVDQTWTYGQTFAAAPQAFLTSRSYLDATPMTNRIRNSPTQTKVVFYQQAGSANFYHLAAEDVSAVVIPSGTVTGYPPLTVWNINDSGGGSLRGAIDYANANAAEDDITFAIPGTGPYIISPLTALPNITDDNVSIDGTSQSGAVCNALVTGTPHVLQIQIDGVSSTDAEGLYVNADNVALSGLSITGFDSRAIRISGPSNNASVDCSYLGVNPDGTTKNANARGDSTGSVLVLAGDGVTVTRSVISGNDDDGGDVGVYISGDSAVLTGNIIGLTADGSTAMGNGNYGFNIRPEATNTTIGGIASSDRNIISGNGGDGLYIDGTSTVTILGNYIGTDVTGLIDRGNGDNGITADSSASGLAIGGTSAGARNVISGNTLDGISLDSVSNITVLGNYIGIGADGSTAIANASDGIQASATTTLTIGNATSNGRNVISANGNGGSSGEGINITGGSTAVTILGNYIGTDSTAALDVGNLDEGIVINGSGTSAVIGDGTTAGRNIIAANNGSGVYVVSSATADINGNLIGVGIGGEALGNSGGVFFNGSGMGTVRNNTIANDSTFGVGISSTTKAAVIANEIYLNTGLGIDNNIDGLTLNDSGDVDTGGNDLLNFPVINAMTSDGATALSYDFDLDVPANANGYRIDFYKDSNALVTDNGQGEVHLGFVDIAHAGGDLNFTGTFTTNDTVSVGNIISATATRKTGASSYDMTSEFSLAYTSDAATELTAAKTVDVFDPTSAGLYALPGNDIVSSMTLTNIGNSAADADSIVIIDAVPSAMEFYNGDMDDGGPATGPIYFTQTGGAGLSFNHAADAAYSNSPSKPANMAGCTYTPSAGYDSSVTYVCFNPKGAMASGDPDPTMTLQYRSRIK